MCCWSPQLSSLDDGAGGRRAVCGVLPPALALRLPVPLLLRVLQVHRPVLQLCKEQLQVPDTRILPYCVTPASGKPQIDKIGA